MAVAGGVFRRLGEFDSRAFVPGRLSRPLPRGSQWPNYRGAGECGQLWRICGDSEGVMVLAALRINFTWTVVMDC